MKFEDFWWSKVRSYDIKNQASRAVFRRITPGVLDGWKGWRRARPTPFARHSSGRLEQGLTMELGSYSFIFRMRSLLWNHEIILYEGGCTDVSSEHKGEGSLE